MSTADASVLLEGGIIRTNLPQFWYDFGAGQGLFTQALASLLPAESTIVAVDSKDQPALKNPTEKNVYLFRQKIDFSNPDISFKTADGIVIANALHFVADRQSFIQSVSRFLKSDGRIIIVEYDLDHSTPWVPYPVSFSLLHTIATAAGFNVKKIGTQHSSYVTEGMYSAVLMNRKP